MHLERPRYHRYRDHHTLVHVSGSAGSRHLSEWKSVLLSVLIVPFLKSIFVSPLASLRQRGIGYDPWF
jgi:hypothetical protein